MNNLTLDIDVLTKIALKHKYDYKTQEVVGGYLDPGHWWQVEESKTNKIVSKRYPQGYEAKLERDRLNMRAGIADIVGRIQR